MEVYGQYCDHHKQVHHAFLKDVLTLKEEFDRDKSKHPKELLEYLINWLVFHILGEDMSMSRQITSIKQGLSAEKAFEMETKSKDTQTTMLLTSLNKLFESISEKNKRLKELNQSLEDKVEKRTKELLKANETLNRLATTDALTGLANRRKAMDVLQLLWEETRQNGTCVSCMMIDADNFKQINDTYGHDAGDVVLKELSRNIEHAVRTADILCRRGVNVKTFTT